MFRTAAALLVWLAAGLGLMLADDGITRAIAGILIGIAMTDCIKLARHLRRRTAD